jgi:hypothetical protein
MPVDAIGFVVLSSSTKRVKNFGCSVTIQFKSGFPMRVSYSSRGGDARQVSRIEGENRALIATAGELKP